MLQTDETGGGDASTFLWKTFPERLRWSFFPKLRSAVQRDDGPAPAKISNLKMEKPGKYEDDLSTTIKSVIFSNEYDFMC